MSSKVFNPMSKRLPPFAIDGVLRRDVLRAHAEDHGIIVFVPGEPAVAGQQLVVEVRLDVSRCTWSDSNDTTDWCLLTGAVRDGGDPSLLIGTGMVATTAPVPRELQGSFKVLLQENEGEWELIRLVKNADASG